jgi:hypothetical protein
MNKFIRNIVVVLIFASMLVGVFGLQLHYHTCGISGNRTFQILETPSCACELESEISSDCCEIESEQTDICPSHTNKSDDKQLSFVMMDCCQDNIYSIDLQDAYLQFVNKIQIARIAILHNYTLISSKQKLDDLKCKLNRLKTLFKLPRDIVFKIIHLTLYTSSLDLESDSY